MSVSKKKTKYLFATGMFRSGTTLTSKVLDAHQKISFAADPYRPFFNEFRDHLAEMHGLKTQWTPHMPLDSYFFNDDTLKLMKIVQNSDLNIPISKGRLRRMLQRVKIHQVVNGANEMCPRITKHLPRLKGRTYRELYINMMKLVDECYGKEGAHYTGMKDGWCTEFVRPLIKTFPDMKFILVLRNPRAVFASNVMLKEYNPKTHTFIDKKARYPWLFLIRQWRKLAIMTWLHSTSPELKKSVHVLRYEDLVSAPQESGKKICQFLNIDFHPSMVDGSRFRDGFGKPWKQNSSYKGAASGGITVAHKDNWKQTLQPWEIQLIERLCYAEMKLFGHDAVDSPIKITDVLNPPILKESEVATWIRKYSNLDPIFNSADMAKEFLRKQMVALPSSELKNIDERIIEGLFIDRRYFNKARQIAKETRG